jgi:type III pantothenate kinase
MNLIIDIGNTRTKYAIYKDKAEIFTDFSINTSVENLNKIKINYPAIKKTIICATGPVTGYFLDECRNLFHPILEFNQQTMLPFKCLYKTRETIGLDRLAAVAGAKYLYPDKNVLIIDAGTAITYDLKTKSNEFPGGNISPGLTMRFKALHNFTHKLPLVELSKNATLLGNSTQQAILNGVVNGAVLEIDGMIGLTEKIYEDLTIILTGGDAPFFDYMLKKTIFVVQNLVSIGLNTILNYNVPDK